MQTSATNWLQLPFPITLAQALQSSCDVSVLKLQDCSIKVEGTLELAKLTAHLRALTILDFSFNVIGSDGAKVLGEFVLC